MIYKLAGINLVITALASSGLTQLSHAIATRQAARGCRKAPRVQVVRGLAQEVALLLVKAVRSLQAESGCWLWQVVDPSVMVVIAFSGEN
jgi:hypothetical protein